MLQSKRFKKGFTLMELTIVLAIVSIVSVMAITFSALISGKISVSTKKLNFMQDVNLVETSLEAWVDELILQEADFVVEDGVLKAVKNSTNYTVRVEYGVLVAVFPTRTLTINAESIDSLSVEIVKKDNERLFLCTVSTTIKNTPNFYVFTINPYVGDVV